MSIHFKELVSITLILFSVIDIIGSLPLIIDLKKRGQHIQAEQASVVAFLFMCVFLFGGKPLLSLFGVSVEAFAVAGALVIFLLGLEMVLGIRIFHDNPQLKSGTIVPVAFPLIAGAGSMTTIISLKAKYETPDILLGILLNILFVYLILRSSDWLAKRLGIAGSIILQKIFGIILLSIAIQLFSENYSHVYS